MILRPRIIFLVRVDGTFCRAKECDPTAAENPFTGQCALGFFRRIRWRNFFERF